MIRLAIALSALSQATICDAARSASGDVGDAAPSQEIAPISAGIFLGRIESCLVNPPLVLLSSGVAQASSDGDHVLRASPSSNGAVTVAAFAPVSATRDAFGALVVDVLSISRSGVQSETGETWKIFDASYKPSEARLVAKHTDYSVCQVPPTSAIQGATVSATETFPAALRAIGASSLLDILGISAGSYIRLRLSSNPTQAEIFLSGIRQPPRTNTVLDVLEAAVPSIVVQKDGYEPCSLERKNLKLARRDATIEASCNLTPVKKNRRARP